MADYKDIISETGLIHRLSYSILLTRTNAWVNLVLKVLTFVLILDYYFSVFVLNYIAVNIPLRR